MTEEPTDTKSSVDLDQLIRIAQVVSRSFSSTSTSAKSDESNYKFILDDVKRRNILGSLRGKETSTWGKKICSKLTELLNSFEGGTEVPGKVLSDLRDTIQQAQLSQEIEKLTKFTAQPSAPVLKDVLSLIDPGLRESEKGDIEAAIDEYGIRQKRSVIAKKLKDANTGDPTFHSDVAKLVKPDKATIQLSQDDLPSDLTGEARQLAQSLIKRLNHESDRKRSVEEQARELRKKGTAGSDGEWQKLAKELEDLKEAERHFKQVTNGNRESTDGFVAAIEKFGVPPDEAKRLADVIANELSDDREKERIVAELHDFGTEADRKSWAKQILDVRKKQEQKKQSQPVPESVNEARRELRAKLVDLRKSISRYSNSHFADNPQRKTFGLNEKWDIPLEELLRGLMDDLDEIAAIDGASNKPASWKLKNPIEEVDINENFQISSPTYLLHRDNGDDDFVRPVVSVTFSDKCQFDPKEARHRSAMDEATIDAQVVVADVTSDTGKLQKIWCEDEGKPFLSTEAHRQLPSTHPHHWKYLSWNRDLLLTLRAVRFAIAEEERLVDAQVSFNQFQLDRRQIMDSAQLQRRLKQLRDRLQGELSAFSDKLSSVQSDRLDQALAHFESRLDAALVSGGSEAFIEPRPRIKRVGDVDTSQEIWGLREATTVLTQKSSGVADPSDLWKFVEADLAGAGSTEGSFLSTEFLNRKYNSFLSQLGQHVLNPEQELIRKTIDPSDSESNNIVFDANLDIPTFLNPSPKINSSLRQINEIVRPLPKLASLDNFDAENWGLFGGLLKTATAMPAKVLAAVFMLFAPFILFGFGNPLKSFVKDTGAGATLDPWVAMTTVTVFAALVFTVVSFAKLLLLPRVKPRLVPSIKLVFSAIFLGVVLKYGFLPMVAADWQGIAWWFALLLGLGSLSFGRTGTWILASLLGVAIFAMVARSLDSNLLTPFERSSVERLSKSHGGDESRDGATADSTIDLDAVGNISLGDAFDRLKSADDGAPARLTLSQIHEAILPLEQIAPGNDRPLFDVTDKTFRQLEWLCEKAAEVKPESDQNNLSSEAGASWSDDLAALNADVENFDKIAATRLLDAYNQRGTNLDWAEFIQGTTSPDLTAFREYKRKPALVKVLMDVAGRSDASDISEFSKTKKNEPPIAIPNKDSDPPVEQNIRETRFTRLANSFESARRANLETEGISRAAIYDLALQHDVLADEYLAKLKAKTGSNDTAMGYWRLIWFLGLGLGLFALMVSVAPIAVTYFSGRNNAIDDDDTNTKSWRVLKWADAPSGQSIRGVAFSFGITCVLIALSTVGSFYVIDSSHNQQSLDKWAEQMRIDETDSVVFSGNRANDADTANLLDHFHLTQSWDPRPLDSALGHYSPWWTVGPCLLLVSSLLACFGFAWSSHARVVRQKRTEANLFFKQSLADSVRKAIIDHKKEQAVELKQRLGSWLDVTFRKLEFSLENKLRDKIREASREQESLQRKIGDLGNRKDDLEQVDLTSADVIKGAIELRDSVFKDIEASMTDRKRGSRA